MTVVITTCTNRKRRAVTNALHIASLGPARVADLAAEWAIRLASESVRYSAYDIYGGRGFQEARSVAIRLEARFLVVSAGLGLIDATTQIPPYACTIVANAADSVACQIEGAFSTAEWWTELSRRSPFGLCLRDVIGSDDGLILAALSDAYIEMVSAELVALPGPVRSRLRLFTRAPHRRIPSQLLPYVMPYDDRLDGPDSVIPGTLSDFAGRALRHFTDHVLTLNDRRTAIEHASHISKILAAWGRAEKATRVRLDDAKILQILRKHWGDPSGVPLTRLRGEFKIACEQSRYARLGRIVRSDLK